MSKLEKGMAWQACKPHKERKKHSKKGREGEKKGLGETGENWQVENKKKIYHIYIAKEKMFQSA